MVIRVLNLTDTLNLNFIGQCYPDPLRSHQRQLHNQPQSQTSSVPQRQANRFTDRFHGNLMASRADMQALQRIVFQFADTQTCYILTSIIAST